MCLCVYNINISNTCITSIMKNTKNVIAIIFNSLIFRIFFLYEMEIFLKKKECLHCYLDIFCIDLYLFFFFKICFLFIYQFHFLPRIFFLGGGGEGRRKVWDSVYKWFFFYYCLIAKFYFIVKLNTCIRITFKKLISLIH